MSSPAIQQIDKTSVHKICSGQVVLDLATAIKELVENSLDAGGKKIDIKLKEYGKELIEVSDDGLGIEESNFEGLALKHHTSKLREFSDLTAVDTYGFRGEALSSLSALSNLTITTQNKSSTIGYKLEFDHNGKLVCRQPTARECGTMVCVSDLFHTLPVRYKEFQKNFKRDFTKLCHVIYAYCLVNATVRFTCANIVGKKKTVIASTKGNESALDVISSLFGVSQTKKLIPFKQFKVDVERAEEFCLSSDLLQMYEDLFTVRGFISTVTHGFGRSSPDRQFFFVNSRPCDHQKLQKTVNEMYHKYNNNQYPFVFLEVLTNKDCVDVNITPDKRQVLLQQEKILFAIVKSSLRAMFDQQATFYTDNNKGDLTANSCTEQEPPTSNNRQSSSSLDKFRCKYAKFSPERTQTKIKIAEITQPKLNDFFQTSHSSSQKRPHADLLDFEAEVKPQKYLKTDNNDDDDDDDDYDNGDDSLTSTIESNFQSIVDHQKTTDISSKEKLKFDSKMKAVPVNQTITIEETPTDICSKRGVRKKLKVCFNIKRLTSLFKSDRNLNITKDQSVSCFRAKITTNENVAAEEELKRHVSKDMFLHMKVLGQFNLGFIIAKLKDDLFIVDQHATDEKYNFETLQKKHILKTQKLIQPVPLELTPVQSSILKDNADIFKKNGFAFDLTESNCIKLVSAPVHRNWSFGTSDVEELIFLLSDSPGNLCRPSRVRQMFASRACRTSIMVGTALSKQNMKKLLVHMSEIDHPWNCPHGRPTMRHLINLHRLKS